MNVYRSFNRPWEKLWTSGAELRYVEAAIRMEVFRFNDTGILTCGHEPINMALLNDSFSY
jgi:hypothetical protein